mmetsp:Transcript_1606/g.4643  ORF Transcript_1606/g.4643 Transcript_1606/m.4643 type:complete len:201 (-) Transcript_1606:178-780(-)
MRGDVHRRVDSGHIVPRLPAVLGHCQHQGVTPLARDAAAPFGHAMERPVMVVVGQHQPVKQPGMKADGVSFGVWVEHACGNHLAPGHPFVQGDALEEKSLGGAEDEQHTALCQLHRRALYHPVGHGCRHQQVSIGMPRLPPVQAPQNPGGVWALCVANLVGALAPEGEDPLPGRQLQHPVGHHLGNGLITVLLLEYGVRL